MKKITLIKFALLAFFAGLFLTVSAQAATLTVTKTADTNDTVCDADCSLREALDVADGNGQADTINFNIPAADPGCGGTASCTITLTGVIQSAEDGGNLTMVSGTGTNVITLSGGNATKLFNIYDNVKISMSFLTIANGNGVSASSSGFGGAILIFGAGSALTLDNVTLRNNSATFGGAINANTLSTLTITNSTVRNNSASGDGSISVFGTATLTNSTVSNNSATNGTAGGIYVYTNANLTLTNSTVSGNSATGSNGAGGGGIFNNGTATLTNSTVDGNSSINSSSGGGIYNSTGSILTLTNSTVNGNSSSLNGGGIRNFGTANLISSTFSNNSATGTGGGISSSGTTTLDNTIIANSLAGGDCARPAVTINATYSLIEDNLTCVNGTNSNNLTGDPNLGPLQNNGGTTATHVLLPGSIAIDTGNSALTTDQRGATRPVDNPNSTNGTGNLADIGAFEVQAAPTAASVSISGRVLSGKRGVSNAIVYMTDQNGNTRTARTSSFGYFRFDSIEAGQTVILSVISKRFQFNPQVISLVDNITNLDFTAQTSGEVLR